MLRTQTIFVFILAYGALYTFGARGETISNSSGARIYPVQTVPSVTTNNGSDDRGMTMLQTMAEMLKRAKAKGEAADVEKSYRETTGAGATPSLSSFFNNSSGFALTAKECGEKYQQLNSPAVHGRTMCGRAVAQMIECVAPSIGGFRQGCTGGCGDGKMFVNCSNNQMAQCGYSKLDPSDARCAQSGAVLAYNYSPTKRGRKFGHVEFVCGDNKYCSVYGEPHDRPWPSAPPDACWYPGTSGGAAP